MIDGFTQPVGLGDYAHEHAFYDLLLHSAEACLSKMSDISIQSRSSLSAAAGVTGSYEGNSVALKVLVVFCAGLSIYNAFELVALVFLTFSHYRTLYFWSLLISSFSLIPYGLGFSFIFFKDLTGNWRWISIILLTIGWYAMVTGQSLVLWSRLHLIVSGEKGRKILLYTKWMIIVDAIVLHTSTTIVTFGSNGNTHTAVFVEAYNIVEKIQMIGFL